MHLFLSITALYIGAFLSVHGQQGACKPIYVKWPKAALDKTPHVRGSFTLPDCEKACTNRYHPKNRQVKVPCSAFNFESENSIGSPLGDCQFFKEELVSMDQDIVAKHNYDFYRQLCVQSETQCDTVHQFTMTVDSFMDTKEVNRMTPSDTVEHCLALCLNEKTFECHSASYNRTGRYCLLSAINEASNPKAVKLNVNPNFRIDYYETNCDYPGSKIQSFASKAGDIIFTYECKLDGIQVAIQSPGRPFTGHIYAVKNYLTCRGQPKRINRFEFFFPYPTISKRCTESMTKKATSVFLEVAVSENGEESVESLRSKNRIYTARCPAPVGFLIDKNGEQNQPLNKISPTNSNVETDGNNNDNSDNSKTTKGTTTKFVPWWHRDIKVTPSPGGTTKFIPWWRRNGLDNQVGPTDQAPLVGGTTKFVPWWRRTGLQNNVQGSNLNPSGAKPTMSPDFIPWWKRKTTTKTTGDLARAQNQLTGSTRGIDKTPTPTPSNFWADSTFDASTNKWKGITTPTHPGFIKSVGTKDRVTNPVPWWKRKSVQTTTPLPKATTTTTTTEFVPTTPSLAPTTTTPLEDIHMEFLNYVGIPTSAVKVQSPVTLRISPGSHLGISPLQISLFECTVEPTQSKFSYAPLRIIENGCPADGVGLVDSIDVDQFGIAVSMGPLRYTDSAESLYKCKVRVCKVQCPTYSCVNSNSPQSAPFISHGRRRRRQIPIIGRTGGFLPPIGLDASGNQVPLAAGLGIFSPSAARATAIARTTRNGPVLPTPTNPLLLSTQGLISNWLAVDYKDVIVEKKLIVLNSNIALQYYIRTGIIPIEEQPR